MSTSELTTRIKKTAGSLGFFRVGIAPGESLDGSRLDVWLKRGYHGDMSYMQKHRDTRIDPALLMPNAKSIIVCAINYYTPVKATPKPQEGRFSRYAWGDDYHDLVRSRLQKLLTFIREECPGVNGRVFVDSAPVMEKEWALRAGIGWYGKHSNIITRDYGSWFFLGEVIVDCELDYDEPFQTDYCGSCTRCIDACPTNAIIQPRLVDARKCISYLTIELKHDRPYPEELKAKVGNLIFGCDICQDVCPWNKRFARPTDEPAFQPRPYNVNPKLEDLIKIDINEFRTRYHKSPVKRAKFDGFKRNVSVALENYFNKKF
ncbi:tRNA epoxyqueuosine(34) reductase QueG [candidate division KSB1 bacterium]|nr:tRNA epoxyqueuosine(34) reductase QueG [candidate division KSB1 bacterium]